MNPVLEPSREVAGAAKSKRWLKPLLILGVASMALSGCYYYDDPYYGGPYYYGPAPVVVAPSFWVGPRYRHGWRGRRWHR